MSAHTVPCHPQGGCVEVYWWAVWRTWSQCSLPGGERCDQVNSGRMCYSPVLHQVELLEALLNYYILNTLYSEVNGKYHYGFLQVKSGHCFCGERELDLELEDRALLEAMRPWASHFPMSVRGLSSQWEC